MSYDLILILYTLILVKIISLRNLRSQLLIFLIWMYGHLIVNFMYVTIFIV